MTTDRTIDPMRTILLVDDHAGFRRRARELLEGSAFTVVGEASDGPSALAEAAALRPQVVLLDIGLPGDDGFAVARELHVRRDAPSVVLTSSRPSSAYGPRLAETLAVGFLRKDELTASAVAKLVDGPR